jgi:hypothetical protein
MIWTPQNAHVTGHASPATTPRITLTAILENALPVEDVTVSMIIMAAVSGAITKTIFQKIPEYLDLDPSVCMVQFALC